MKLHEVLSASEALYGFCGWLTARKKKTVMGSSHEAGNVAEKVGKFMTANKLKAPREGWEKKLVHPKEDV